MSRLKQIEEEDEYEDEEEDENLRRDLLAGI